MSSNTRRWCEAIFEAIVDAVGIQASSRSTLFSSFVDHVHTVSSPMALSIVGVVCEAQPNTAPEAAEVAHWLLKVREAHSHSHGDLLALNAPMDTWANTCIASAKLGRC